MKLALATCLILAAGAASAQPSFRIDPSVQATRDTDRVVILAQERNEEIKALEAAERALASATPGKRDKATATVDRHRKNLAALDAEIKRAGGGAAPAVAVAAAGPVRLKAASAAPVQAAASPAPEVPFWDVYRRKQAD